MDILPACDEIYSTVVLSPSIILYRNQPDLQFKVVLYTYRLITLRYKYSSYIDVRYIRMTLAVVVS